MKIGTEERKSFDISRNLVGPANYSIDTDMLRKSAPKFSFGTERKNMSMVEKMKRSMHIPGPGKYPVNIVGVGKDGQPCYSIGKDQRNTFKSQKGPAPNAYSVDHSPTRYREPTMSFGSEVRKDYAAKAREKFTTGPGDYDPLTEHTRFRAAGWKMGSEKRPDLVSKDHKSSPGAAYFSIPMRSAPRYGFGT